MNTISYMQKAGEAATANGDAFKSMLDISLSATQKLFELNGDLVRSLVTNDSDTTSGFDFNKQVNLHTQRLERTSEYLRDFNAICLSTQAEIAKLNAEQTGSLMQAITTQLDEFSKTGPLDAAGFSEMFNTARELTESSLNAAMSVLQPAARETSRKVASPRKAA